MQALQYSTRALRALGLALLVHTTGALADDSADIGKLMRAGQWPAALARVDVALTQRPKDTQLRFLRGMILAEQGKAQDAIAVFQKLTEDHPELPEPYNNLAVLHAAAGNYDKARQALEKAIRTNPTYATAHENLGDVYAKLASQSYDKAMQLLDANAANAPKSQLTMVRSLDNRQPAMAAKAAPLPAAAGAAAALKPATPSAKADAPLLAAAPAAKPAAVNAAPAQQAAIPPAKPGAPVLAGAPQAKPAPSPAPVAAPAPQAATPTVAAAPPGAKPAPAAGPASAPAPAVAAAAAATAKPSPAAKPAVDDSARADIAQAIDAWAKAWSAQDMKAYFNAYSGNFQPPRGQTRKAWEADRTARIEGKGHITVTVDAVQVSIDGDKATAKFRQRYLSDRLNSNSRKTLQLERQGKRWLIRQESSGG